MENNMSTQTALEAYEEKQAEIKKLLAQITVGLEAHDRKASSKGEHHWGHVGDLTDIAAKLADIKDSLYETGEYAKPARTFDRNGRRIKVTIPLTD